MEEDVFQARASHQGGLGIYSSLMEFGKLIFGVVGVDQNPVGQGLHPLAETLQPGNYFVLHSNGEPKLQHFAGGVLFDEAARGTFSDDGTFVHDHQAVAELFGLVHVVSGDDEGGASLFEAIETVPENVACLRVEAGGGLVEDHQFGVVDEGASDG
jgi:hypothetical protein